MNWRALCSQERPSAKLRQASREMRKAPRQAVRRSSCMSQVDPKHPAVALRH